MKAAAFRYHRPGSLDETVELMARLPEGRLLAGGQSLMPMLNLRVTAVADLVDLNRVGGLDGIEVVGQSIRLGAMLRQHRLLTDPLIGRHLPLMVEASAQIGHAATRNRGTLGGSLCHLDPAAELPVVAAAFDAHVQIVSIRGCRSVAMSDFHAGLMTPAIEADEIVTAFDFDPWPDGHGWSFMEFSRRPGDFAIVSAAAMIDAPDGRVRRARLVLGGLQERPVIVAAAESLIGQVPDSGQLVELATSCSELKAMDDPQTPSWYRQRLAGVMARRALAAALYRALEHATPRHAPTLHV